MNFCQRFQMASVSSPEMHQELAQQMFSEGGAVVMLNVPPGTEVGIDLQSWNVGPKFKGIKLIPPGLHFIYYSAVSKQGQTAPRTGFFCYIKPKEIIVRTYKRDTEEFTLESAEQEERVRADIRNLDKELGCYPLDSWRRWFSLTQHLTETYVNVVIPSNGVVSSVPVMLPVDDPATSPTVNSDARKKLKTSHCCPETASVISDESVMICECASTSPNKNDTDSLMPDEKVQNPRIEDVTSTDDSSSHDLTQESTEDCNHEQVPAAPSDGGPSDGLPELVPAPGTEWRWRELPKRPYRLGATPAEITASSIDSSYLLNWLIDTMDSSEDVVKELQLSFVVFLVGQTWGGWERWKKLLDVICRAEQSLLDQPLLFSKLMAAVHFQIQEVPEDLFVDIVEQQNFLAGSLSSLFANVTDNGPALPTALVDRASKFRQHLTKRFGWDFDVEGIEEQAPVVVEL